MNSSQATFGENTQFYLHGFKLKAIGFALSKMKIRDTQVLKGAEGITKLASMVAQSKLKKALIVTTTGAIKRGFVDKLVTALKDNGVESAIYSGVIPDPTFTTVNEGLAIAKTHDCDCAIALGGGSVMDAAKAIIVAATNDTPVEKLMGVRKGRNRPLPFYAIPTTAGTASEVSTGAVISDDKTHIKKFMVDSRTVAKVAVLDPSLSALLPSNITAETGMDAMTHALEAYISKNSSEETDKHAVQAIQEIFIHLPTAVKDGGNLEARQAMAMASLTAGKAFRTAMLGYVHAISHQFGALYGTPHGQGNAILLPLILEYSKDAVEDKLASLAVTLGLGKQSESNSALAQKVIDDIKKLNAELNIPTTLKPLKDEDIATIASNAFKEALKVHAAPKYMGKASIQALLKKLL